MKRKDLTGMKVGRLTVLRYYATIKGHAYWECVCECGNHKNIIASSLTSGNTKSCGCLWTETILKAVTHHGFSRRNRHNHIKNIHRAMLSRCCCPTNNQYKNYGGRGITVCEEWHDLKVFGEWALAHGCKEGLQIDRIDNNGNYEPANCRFVTPQINSSNRRVTRFVEIDGIRKPLTLWAKEYGIHAWTIRNRLKAGYTGKILLRKENLNG